MRSRAEIEAQARAGFADPSAVRTYAVPGRVNLMGDHTDYNQGFSLPVAIDRWCVVACAASGPGGEVRARSGEVEGAVVVAASGRDDPRRVEPAWGRFVAGAVRVL